MQQAPEANMMPPAPFRFSGRDVGISRVMFGRVWQVPMARKLRLGRGTWRPGSTGRELGPRCRDITISDRVVDHLQRSKKPRICD